MIGQNAIAPVEVATYGELAQLIRRRIEGGVESRTPVVTSMPLIDDSYVTTLGRVTQYLGRSQNTELCAVVMNDGAGCLIVSTLDGYWLMKQLNIRPECSLARSLRRVSKSLTQVLQLLDQKQASGPAAGAAGEAPAVDRPDMRTSLRSCLQQGVVPRSSADYAIFDPSIVGEDASAYGGSCVCYVADLHRAAALASRLPEGSEWHVVSPFTPYPQEPDQESWAIVVTLPGAAQPCLFARTLTGNEAYVLQYAVAAAPGGDVNKEVSELRPQITWPPSWTSYQRAIGDLRAQLSKQFAQSAQVAASGTDAKLLLLNAIAAGGRRSDLPPNLMAALRGDGRRTNAIGGGVSTESAALQLLRDQAYTDPFTGEMRVLHDSAASVRDAADRARQADVLSSPPNVTIPHVDQSFCLHLVEQVVNVCLDAGTRPEKTTILPRGYRVEWKGENRATLVTPGGDSLGSTGPSNAVIRLTNDIATGLLSEIAQALKSAPKTTSLSEITGDASGGGLMLS